MKTLMMLDPNNTPFAKLLDKDGDGTGNATLDNLPTPTAEEMADDDADAGADDGDDDTNEFAKLFEAEEELASYDEDTPPEPKPDTKAKGKEKDEGSDDGSDAAAAEAKDKEGSDGDKAAATPESDAKADEQPATPPAQPEAEPQGEQPSPQVQLTPEQRAEALETLRQQQLETLTKQYALTDEEVEELETNPKEAFPKYAARVHQDAVMSAVRQVLHVMPRIVQQISQTTQHYSERENEFFSDFPELKDHKNEVLQVGQLYRAQNPQASKDDFKKFVGNYTMQMLGISRQPQQPAAPAVPPSQEPAFNSAAGGRRNTPPEPTNEFEILDRQIERL